MGYPKGTKISTRHDAIAKGLDTYISGYPCKRGHTGPRRCSTQVCIQCSKEVHQVTDRDNYRNSENTFRRQFNTRRQQAKNRGIPFEIEFEDMEQPEYCPVLGIKLNYGWSGEDRRDPAKASLDKIVPELGYVKGNVKVISWRANVLKRDMTLIELEKIMKYIKDNTQ